MRRTLLIAFVIVAAALTAGACGGDTGSRVPPARAVQVSGCSPITYGGKGRPDLLIGTATVLAGQFVDHGIQTSQALKMTLGERDWSAGDYTVGLQICGETTPAGDAASPKLCRRTARAFARNRSIVVAYGPLFSTCAAEMLPILNAAVGGPVPEVVAGPTYLGLTRSGPGVARGDPDRFYPSGTRSLIRLAPPDDVSGAAAAMFAKQQGAGAVFALNDGESYGVGVSEAFAEAARRLGLKVVGRASWNPKAHDYRALAQRARRDGAEAVFLGGYVFNNGGQLIKDLRETLGPGAELLGPDGFNNLDALTEGAGAAAEDFAPLIAVLPNDELPEPGREFAADFEERYGARPCCFAVHVAEAARMMLDAIANSDGSRGGVLEQLRETPVEDGYVGNFEIDRYGDTTLRKMGVYRVEDGRLRFQTAISPPADLLDRR